MAADRLVYYPNPEWWEGMPNTPTRLEVVNTNLDDNNKRPALTVYELRGAKRTMMFWDTVTQDELKRRWLTDAVCLPQVSTEGGPDGQA